MAPPCPVIEAAELPVKIQETAEGKKRKLKPGQREIDLSQCPMFELLQYKCEVQQSVEARDSPVRCYVVDRLFRRCVFAHSYVSTQRL